MNFNIFKKNSLGFALNISEEELNFKIRYATFVENYSIPYKIVFSSESSEFQSKTYKIRYESSREDDDLLFKIRYEANVVLEDYSNTYRVRYESESMSNSFLNFRVRFETEGLETYEGKKIYRIFYENESVSSASLNFKIRYQVEASQLISQEYKIVYESEQSQQVMTTRTLLKDSNGKVHLLIGVYSKEENFEIHYGIVHNIPSKLFLEYEVSKDLECEGATEDTDWIEFEDGEYDVYIGDMNVPLYTDLTPSQIIDLEDPKVEIIGHEILIDCTGASVSSPCISTDQSNSPFNTFNIYVDGVKRYSNITQQELLILEDTDFIVTECGIDK